MDKKAIGQTLLAGLQTVTGLFLVVFTSIHFLGISTINFGDGWFNFYMSHLDKTNILIKFFVWIVYVAVFIHGLNGLKIAFKYLTKPFAVEKYLTEINSRGSLLWFVHFLCGVVIFVVISIHLAMACLSSISPITTIAIIKNHLQNGYYVMSMIILLWAVVFHALYGLKTFFVKYGIFPSSQNKVSWVLIVVGIIAIVLCMNNLMLFV